MANQIQVWIVIIGTFVFVSTIIMFAGSYVLRRGLVRSRLAAGAFAVPGSPAGTPLKVIDRIDDELIGLNPQERNKLRFELLRAGYFSVDAPKVLVVIRSLLMIGLPLCWYLFASLIMSEIPPDAGLTGLPLRWLLAGVLAYLGYIAPNAYVKRRQTRMTDSYRIAFPDFLDLLLVCVDAGLSLDAALVRVGREFTNQAPEFATNLALLSSEMRSGRSTTEALDNLSDRLGLDEARAFSTLLKQSIELGSNIGDALRIYADEMRDKRMMRAEARANVLPVKMVLPLGAFIFPVILIVILAPVLISLSRIFGQILGG
ncbi:MAG: type II secretion system F family protein [Beijerinckiaceae bacterium]|nr:type II secretion system F family protein [Beijerinckiaceae bacterium]MCI0737203.1 type II secretion system F family protein [Beijerinckiaceae bacterium]